MQMHGREPCPVPRYSLARNQARRANCSTARAIPSSAVIRSPSSATRDAQNGWSEVNGTTTCGTSARKAALVVALFSALPAAYLALRTSQGWAADRSATVLTELLMHALLPNPAG